MCTSITHLGLSQALNRRFFGSAIPPHPRSRRKAAQKSTLADDPSCDVWLSSRSRARKRRRSTMTLARQPKALRLRRAGRAASGDFTAARPALAVAVCPRGATSVPVENRRLRNSRLCELGDEVHVGAAGLERVHNEFAPSDGLDAECGTGFACQEILNCALILFQRHGAC